MEKRLLINAIGAYGLIAFLVLNALVQISPIPDYFDFDNGFNSYSLGWPFTSFRLELDIAAHRFASWWPTDIKDVCVHGLLLNVAIGVALIILMRKFSLKPNLPKKRFVGIAFVLTTAIVSCYSSEVPGAFGTCNARGWPLPFLKSYGEDSPVDFGVSFVTFFANWFFCWGIVRILILRVESIGFKFGIRLLFVGTFVLCLYLASVARLLHHCREEQQAARSLQVSGITVQLRDYTPWLLGFLPEGYRQQFSGISTILVDERTTVGSFRDFRGSLHHATAVVSGGNAAGVSVLRLTSKCELKLVDLSNCTLSERDVKLLCEMDSIRHLELRGSRIVHD